LNARSSQGWNDCAPAIAARWRPIPPSNLEEGEPDPKPTMLNDTMARCLSVEVLSWKFPTVTWEGQVQFVRPPVFFARVSAKPEKPGDPKEVIRQAIGARNADYKACYEAYMRRSGPSDRAIRVKTRIRIENGGRVSEASVVDPTALEPGFRACLVGALRALTFGKLKGDGHTIVDYPFVFEPDR
jgi:hypothetical protein